MDDQALLTRQAELQQEAAAAIDELHLIDVFIDEWKIDVSIWSAGMRPDVESFQTELLARLTDELRIAILRLKDAWCTSDSYPEIVSAWQIYDAVLEHDVQTLEELDDHLSARGFPTRTL